MRILILLLFLTNTLLAQTEPDLDADVAAEPDTIIVIDSALAAVDTFVQKIDTFDISKYPYVQGEYNMMLGFDSSRGATFAFWPLLDSLLTNKNFRINVLHFGGSHIQADIYSNLLRDSMQTMADSMAGPRGLIFPYRVAKTNNPRNYHVDYTGTWEGHRSAVSYHKGTWGVTGITVSTTDSLATISVKVRESCPSTPFTEVTILCDTLSGYRVDLLPKENVMVIEHHLSLGYYKFKLRHPTDSMHIVITKTDTTNTAPFELYGIVMDNDEPGIAYHSIGANGASFRSNFRCDLFKQHLVEINPDLVIISIGTNDSFDGNFTEADYMAKYDTFIQMIKAVNSDAQFILTVPNDSYYKRKYPNLNTAKTESAIYKLAVKHNALVWDCYKMMGGLRSSKKWMYAGMMKKDLIHFTYDGYILKGELFWDAFKRSYQNYLDHKAATTAEQP